MTVASEGAYVRLATHTIPTLKSDRTPAEVEGFVLVWAPQLGRGVQGAEGV